MWERMAAEIAAAGGEVVLDAPVSAIRFGPGGAIDVTANGERRTTDAVISSLPLRTLAAIVEPRPAGRRARGRRRPALPRLHLRRPGPRRRRTPSPTTGSTSTSPTSGSAGSRTSAPGAPTSSPSPGAPASASSTSASRATSSGAPPTSELVARAADELERLGLGGATPRRWPDTWSACRRPTRSTTRATSAGCATLRSWLDGLDGLVQVGRNGLHRYNNSDHSMLTAMRAVENLVRRARARHLGGQRRWRLPRGGRARRAAVSRRAGDPGDGAAARRRGRRAGDLVGRPLPEPPDRRRTRLDRPRGRVGAASATIAVPAGGAVRKREWIAESGRSRLPGERGLAEEVGRGHRRAADDPPAADARRPGPSSRRSDRRSRRPPRAGPGISAARTAPCAPSATSSSARRAPIAAARRRSRPADRVQQPHDADRAEHAGDRGGGRGEPRQAGVPGGREHGDDRDPGHRPGGEHEDLAARVAPAPRPPRSPPPPTAPPAAARASARPTRPPRAAEPRSPRGRAPRRSAGRRSRAGREPARARAGRTRAAISQPAGAARAARQRRRRRRAAATPRAAAGPPRSRAPAPGRLAAPEPRSTAPSTSATSSGSESPPANWRSQDVNGSNRSTTPSAAMRAGDGPRRRAAPVGQPPGEPEGERDRGQPAGARDREPQRRRRVAAGREQRGDQHRQRLPRGPGAGVEVERGDLAAPDQPAPRGRRRARTGPAASRRGEHADRDRHGDPGPGHSLRLGFPNLAGRDPRESPCA